MLNLSFCKIRVSATRPLAVGQTSLDEGLALMAVRDSTGTLTVKPTSGTSTDEFAGFSMSERQLPTIFPQVFVGNVVLLSTGVYGVQLPRAIVGTPRVSYTSNNTGLTSNSGLAAGQYFATATPGQVTVNAGDLGKSLTIIYNYSPTIQDMFYLGGDNSPTTFTTMAGVIGATGVIESGEVYTSYYDTSIDWLSWTPTVGLKGVANGIVTTAAGTGATIKGRVVMTPNTDFPFLGIDCNGNT